MKIVASLLVLAGLLLSGCNDSNSKPPVPTPGKQLYSNSTFTSWPHGTSVSGSFGGGTETADHWMTKWGKNEKSKVIASRLTSAGGIKYTMTPAPGVDWSTSGDKGETYYLRQTYPSLKASLGHKFRVTFNVAAETTGIKGGVYINAWWNRNQRINIYNSVTSIALTPGRQDYTVEFTMPDGAGITWALDDAQGVEATFLFTTDHPAVADVYVGSLVMIQ